MRIAVLRLALVISFVSAKAFHTRLAKYVIRLFCSKALLLVNVAVRKHFKIP
jgi:hypothetical protein